MAASGLYSFSCTKNILDHQQKQCAFPSILVFFTNNDVGIFFKNATIVKRCNCSRLFTEEFVQLALKSSPKLLQAGYLNSPRRYNFR